MTEVTYQNKSIKIKDEAIRNATDELFYRVFEYENISPVSPVADDLKCGAQHIKANVQILDDMLLLGIDEYGDEADEGTIDQALVDIIDNLIAIQIVRQIVRENK